VPYIFAFTNKATLIPKILAAVFDAKENYGQTKDYAGKKGMSITLLVGLAQLLTVESLASPRRILLA